MALSKDDLSTISRYVQNTIQRLPIRDQKAATIGTLNSGDANVSGTLDAGTVTVNGLALPGSYIGYDQITAPVNITGLTEASPTIIIPGSSYTFDGYAVWAEFFAPQVVAPTVGGQAVVIMLFEGTTEIARWGDFRNPTSGNLGAWPVTLRYRFAPTAGNHTYSIKALATSTTGTPLVEAGSPGGSGTYMPAYLSFTKA